MQLELFSEDEYLLIEINLYYFDQLRKNILHKWLANQTNILITKIDYYYQRRRKFTCIIPKRRYTDIVNSISKVVKPELHPVSIIKEHYQLTKDNRYELKRKINRIRNINNRNIVNHTNNPTNHPV